MKISPMLILLLLACTTKQNLSEFDMDNGSGHSPQDESVEYYSENTIRYENHRYRESIRTVQLYRQGDPISESIISLNEGPQLELHFDEIGNELKDYYITVIHCNADWTPSDLIKTQYIEGFFSDAITNYDFSFNTLRPYIHYQTTIPNRSMKLTKSGNYILLVTENDDESKPILSRRFMMVDNKVSLMPNVRQTAVVAERDHKQLVDFEVHHASFDMTNPFRDVKAVILQNQRWDNAKAGLTPVFIRNKVLEYRYEEGNDFWGGNEYRFFNISSVNMATDRIRNIVQLDDHFQVNLVTDQKRNLKNHFNLQDVNGAYLVKTTDGFNDMNESEYVDVHFELAMDNPINFGSIYIYGGLSDRKIDKDYQMKYNEEERLYECTIPLKQGYYEYQYAVVLDRTQEIDFLTIEGSHYETDNDYTVLIYYRDIRNDYDELIGARTFSALDFF